MHIYSANLGKMTKSNFGCFPNGDTVMQQSSDGVSKKKKKKKFVEFFAQIEDVYL